MLHLKSESKVVSNQNIYAAGPISTSSHPKAKIRNAV
uniref:Uncharacterized protein n=1 Tax=Neisseria meningitidis alpha522 TaxID=996307 RepID=I4E828_NEIME|nr:hypothetical protein NMALPHA522_1955 [Neisseria meningitidis alpha522]